ncbi:pyridoxamine 5'-phosphate oxidase-related FMN- binding protein [Natronorubrum bangense JCM 10635]|nr:pyridoxamine 5'-phosphate oxidase-related FMN- binding protein [Natronorubrum bangense JCM 10635]
MLVRNGIGVLAVVDEGIPYAIPMSFGYQGDEMTFAMQWGTGYGGRKSKAIRSNSNVCFTIYEQDSDVPETWRSVVVTGEIYEISEENQVEAFSSLATNAEFASDLEMWGIPFEEIEMSLFGLNTEDCEGREFSSIK